MTRLDVNRTRCDSLTSAYVRLGCTRAKKHGFDVLIKLFSFLFSSLFFTGLRTGIHIGLCGPVDWAEMSENSHYTEVVHSVELQSVRLDSASNLDLDSVADPLRVFSVHRLCTLRNIQRNSSFTTHDAQRTQNHLNFSTLVSSRRTRHPSRTSRTSRTPPTPFSGISGISGISDIYPPLPAV